MNGKLVHTTTDRLSEKLRRKLQVRLTLYFSFPIISLTSPSSPDRHQPGRSPRVSESDDVCGYSCQRVGLPGHGGSAEEL